MDTVVMCLLVLWHFPLSLQALAPSGSPRFHAITKIDASKSSVDICVGDLLSNLPSPTLLMELSLAEGAFADKGTGSLDDVLGNLTIVDATFSLNGTIFLHTAVTDTSERDKITNEEGSGKSQIICTVDTDPNMVPGGAFLGIGLANHHVGGYYWARGMGIGASLPAHGVEFGPTRSNDIVGRLYWRKRGPGTDARETTEESSNSNDGKRSEWADFLAIGDTIQLVPNDTAEVLCNSPYETLLGVRRIGRPMGADPIVERIWVRSSQQGAWVPQQ